MDPTEPDEPAAGPPADAGGPGTDPDESGEAKAGSRSRKTAAGLTTVLGLGLAGAAMFYVGRRLVEDWPEASAALSDAELGWVALGAVSAVLAMTSIGWGWRAVLRLLGVTAPTGRVIAWYYVGELGKYLPGSVWPILGRGELARRGGVPRTRAYASVALSLALLYLAGLFVAAAFLPFALSGGGFSVWMLFLLALPVGIGLLHHDVLGYLVSLVERITKRTIDLEIPSWRDSLSLVARYVPTWIFIGTATWAIARSLTPDASYPKVMFGSVLSWIAGFLAIPVPAGAGIREAVLTATSGLDGGIAAATAIVARILFVLVDVIGALVCAPIASRKRGGATVGPLPEHDEPVVIP